jgi:hypothetical protein
MGNWLAYSNFRYAQQANQAGEHQRLSTHLTWDDPEQLRQLVIGYFTVPGQRLASGEEFLGLSSLSNCGFLDVEKPYNQLILQYFIY